MSCGFKGRSTAQRVFEMKSALRRVDGDDVLVSFHVDIRCGVMKICEDVTANP